MRRVPFGLASEGIVANERIPLDRRADEVRDAQTRALLRLRVAAVARLPAANARLPLCSTERTSLKPSRATASRSSAIDTLTWPPTLIPRSKAM
jgi:hypothetical protein